MTSAPPPPHVRLSLGVTGHTETNATYAAHREQVEAALDAMLSRIDALAAEESETLGNIAPTRLHSLLAGGIDQTSASGAARRGWELVSPLPFGRGLNLAINARPETAADASALLRGEPASEPDVEARARAIRDWYGKAQLFELAEHDEATARRFLKMLEAPNDMRRHQAFSAHSSERVALAGRVMIEQSDFVVAVWDGIRRNLVGGTGHTVEAALAMGTPVLWIDPARPEEWRILSIPESLLSSDQGEADRDRTLAALVHAALRPEEEDTQLMGMQVLGNEAWHPRSSRLWTGYRRIEALFGGDGKWFRSLVQTYETPDGIIEGSGAPVLAAARSLIRSDLTFTDRIALALRRFAWADGISSRLSDSYRGGMIANFLLSALAILSGLAYLPLGMAEHKWLFALTEFVLLGSILLIIWLGGRRRWHKRWFETRRVAEYFRHAPFRLVLGVAHPAGRWPRGSETSWPEYYSRHALRAFGLPRVAITGAYLREALESLLDAHIVEQRDYHIGKAQRLTTVHHRLDKLSTRLFQLAVVAVASYLALAGAAAANLIPQELPISLAKPFTFLGVMFPTLGASIAGMRYFGDFERFAAISEITAEKLDGVHKRIQMLLRAPDDRLDYGSVSQLAHAVDDIVIEEIENWQAVFGGKHISVPV